MVKPGELCNSHSAAVWATHQLLQVFKEAAYFIDTNVRLLLLREWNVNLCSVHNLSFFIHRWETTKVLKASVCIFQTTNRSVPSFLSSYNASLFHLEPPPLETEVIHPSSPWRVKMGSLAHASANNVLSLVIFSLAYMSLFKWYMKMFSEIQRSRWLEVSKASSTTCSRIARHSLQKSSEPARR